MSSPVHRDSDEESLYHDSVSIDEVPYSIPPTPVRESPASTTSSAAERVAHLQELRGSSGSVASITTNPDGTIPNRPPKEPLDPDDEAAEKTLNAELVSDEELSARQMEQIVYSALFDLFVMMPLMVIPSVLVFLFADFNWYWPVDVKGLDAKTNPYMEFIRYNTFAAMAYALFVIADAFSLIIPEAVLISTNDSKLPSIYHVRRQMRALISIRKHVGVAIWLLSLLPLGGLWLYKSSLLTPLSLFSEFFASTETKGAAGKIDKEAVARVESMVLHQQIESFLLAASMFAVILAFEKFLIETIRLHFHKNAFAERIVENNSKFAILGQLYESVTQGKPRILARGNRVQHREILDQRYEDIMYLTSIHRAKSISRTIFRSLLSQNRDHLLKEDFEHWTPDAASVFDVFDPDRTGKVTAEGMESVVVDIYEQRQNLFNSMIGNSRIVNRLDTIFLICALLIGVSMTTPVFDFGIAKILSAIAVFTAGAAFLLQPAAKDIFDSLIFVFVQHVFDVGDRVIIDDESYIVEKIEIMNTTMCRWDGVTVYIPNSTLSSKVIYNIRRSGDQYERVALSLKSDTATASVWKFRSILKDKLAAHATYYTGLVDIADFDKLTADSASQSLTVVAQVRGNFQNIARRNLIKEDLLSKIEASLAEANISRG